MRNWKKLVIAMTTVAMVGSMAACGTGASLGGDKEGVQTMAGEKLQKTEDDKDSKEKILVVDVRSKDEYDAGHVKFAINMPIDTFEQNIAELEDWKDKTIALVCNSGKKSGEAANILVENGYKDVYNADGVKDYEYDLVTWGNIRADELKAAEKDGEAVLIDLRDEKDYQEGHLKNAISMDSENMDAAKNELPSDKDQLIITYCYSGNRSAKAAQYLVDQGYTNVYNCLDGTKEVTYELSK